MSHAQSKLMPCALIFLNLTFLSYCSISMWPRGFEFIVEIFSLWGPYPKGAVELLKRVSESMYVPNIVILIFI